MGHDPKLDRYTRAELHALREFFFAVGRGDNHAALVAKTNLRRARQARVVETTAESA